MCLFVTQVEAVLLQHPGISASVVIGLPHSRLTEMVVACIRLKDNWLWTDSTSNCPVNRNEHCLSSTVLQNFCKAKDLTGYFPFSFVVQLHSIEACLSHIPCPISPFLMLGILLFILMTY